MQQKALFRRVVSQPEAQSILSQELLLSRPYIPQVPLVAMKFSIKTEALRDKLNSILRHLDSSDFDVSHFIGVQQDTLFVILNLSEKNLEREATAIGFQTKIYRLSAKIPYK